MDLCVPDSVPGQVRRGVILAEISLHVKNSLGVS